MPATIERRRPYSGLASPSKLTVSIATAAEMLEASEQTIMRLIKTGKLRAAKVNRRVYIKISDIEAMLNANPAVQS
jgi:excisionase family DNA binding protein